MSSSTETPPAPAYASYTHLHVTIPSPWIAHVEINRPKSLNAFHRALWLEFGKVFDQLSEDGDVRCVVLSGRGERAFTAGLDVKEAGGDDKLMGDLADAARYAKGIRGHIEEFQGCIGAAERCEKPVIAVFHGICLGLAIDIACCTDIRLAASNSTFAVKEVDIGLAADIGTLARLPKIVGSHSWVKDICLTARNFSAAEALSQGFLSAVYEDKAKTLSAAMELAGRIVAKSPVAVQGTKELLNHGRENGTKESLRYTAIWNSVALQGGDFREALGASVGKRKARFEKL